MTWGGVNWSRQSIIKVGWRRGGVEFCLRKSTNVWSLVYFFHIRVLFSCVCSLSQFLMYVHKIITIWMWNVHSNGLGTLSCQVQPPGLLLGLEMEFPPLLFTQSPGFSLFPTLGYYPAFGFLFFLPLAVIEHQVFHFSHPWLLFSTWFFTFTHPWLRFHTKNKGQKHYKGFNQNQGKPGGIIHCCVSVRFCFDLWRKCTVQTIALILVIFFVCKILSFSSLFFSFSVFLAIIPPLARIQQVRGEYMIYRLHVNCKISPNKIDKKGKCWAYQIVSSVSRRACRLLSTLKAIQHG